MFDKEFQFLIGSLKTEIINADKVDSYVKFQFLIGSLKTDSERTYLACGQVRFNSL